MAELETPADYQLGLDTVGQAPLPEQAGSANIAPPPPETGFQRQTVTPGPPSTDPTVNAMNFFRDPQRLGLMAAAAAALNRPDVLHWLQRGHQAQQENTMEALAHLASGDKQGAIDAFNLAGKFKAKSITDGAKAGTYDVVIDQDGKDVSRTIDPKQEIKGLLTPPQYITASDREEMTALRGQMAQSISDLKREQLNERQRHEADLLERDYKRLTETQSYHQNLLDVRRDVMAMTERIAKIRNDRLSTPKMPTWSQVGSQLRPLARDAALNPTTGEPDPELESLYNKEAGRIFARDRDAGIMRTPGEIMFDARNVIDDKRKQATQSVEDDIKRMKTEGKYGSQTDPGGFLGQTVVGSPVERITKKSEAQFRKDETAERFKKLTADTVKATPPAESAPAPVVGGSPYKEGARVKNKAGDVFVIQDGRPVPVTGE